MKKDNNTLAHVEPTETEKTEASQHLADEDMNKANEDPPKKAEGLKESYEMAESNKK